jgi:predicted RNase H-like nuclease
MSRILGVDACAAGWVGVLLEGPDARALFARGIADLTALALDGGPLDVVAIDIPIGLPDHTSRTADTLARRLIPGRASSVFSAPVREALEEADYAAANRLNRERAGVGISKQAHALRAKILDVDGFRRTTPLALIEVHPEVSFARMTGTVLPRTSTWAGMVTRRTALQDGGIVLRDALGLAGEMAGVDDVLDAAAAAWTGRRFASSTAVSYPTEPERFSDGWPSAIWV